MNQSTFTRFLVLMVALFCSVAAFAQTGKITGKIIDEKKEPVMGATVIVAGTTLGSATDMDGNYTIEGVASGEVRVQVSYIGYETKEGTVKVATGKTATLDFSLGENKEMLDAVIITGYGQTQQRRDLTGAISKVDSKAIMAMPTSSFEQSLQGAAAGLQVTQGSGMVGSQSVVRVRGNSSISAGGDPLYVVDGIAITQDYFISKGDNGNTNNNPLSTINPNDIESVEVLKDAAAAAIYGSRGANGVIIITTKRGKKGKPTYNFNTRVGYGEPTKLLKFLTSEEYFAMRQRGWELDGNVGQAPIQPTLAEQGYSRSELEHMNTNWYDEVLRKGVKQEYNLSMRYGGEKLSTYIGTSYSNNQGYVKGNGMERVSGRVNVDYHPIKNLTIGLTTSASRGTIEKQNLLYGGLGGIQWGNNASTAVYKKDGSLYWNKVYGNVVNPIARQQNMIETSRETRFLGGLNINYNILENLTFNITGNYDYQLYGDYTFQTKEWKIRAEDKDKPIDQQNHSYVGLSRTNNYSTYSTLNYTFKLPANHKLNALVGVEYQEATRDASKSSYRGVNGLVYNMDSDTTKRFEYEKWDEKEHYKFFSTFLRANYSYKDRYQLQVTVRRDGSSKFGIKRQFGNFPSVGLGWTLSEENFWKPLKKVITFAKLRGSWGLTGNANIDPSQQYPGFNQPINFGNVSGNAYGGSPTRDYKKLANDQLGWETIETYDGGVQLGFLNDRIVLDATYYYKLTKDAFLQTVIQASTGHPDVLYQNIGQIENKGFEVALTSRNIVSKNAKGFKWTTVLNLGNNQNKVLDIGPNQPDALGGGFGDTRAYPGFPVGTNFLNKFVGIDPADGKPIYLDPKGNQVKVYSPNNRVPIGGIYPLATGGFNNRFDWKGFDLDVNFVFSYLGKVYDDAGKRQRYPIFPDDLLFNQTPEVLTAWGGEGQISNLPRPSTTGGPQGLDQIWQNNTTMFVEDASYLRLRRVGFGYNIPLKTKGIESIRISLTGTNLWTIANYKGWDPEVGRERGNQQERNIGGTSVSFLTAPQERTYMFGLDINF